MPAHGCTPVLDISCVQAMQGGRSSSACSVGFVGCCTHLFHGPAWALQRQALLMSAPYADQATAEAHTKATSLDRKVAERPTRLDMPLLACTWHV